MMPTASAAPGGEKPPLGVYIHFPFCRSKCAYCDFVSYPGREELIPAYVEALTGEIRDWREEISRRRIVSVFFGGGTPSLMDPEQMRVLLTCLADTGCVSPDAEITMEANPGTVTPGALSAFRAMGVDRLSLGVQAAQDPLLRSIGRIHTLKEAAAAVDMAREAGFGNLNLDLMYGLPGQTEADWRETLEWAVSRDPEHISAYSLILEEGTPLYGRVMSGRSALPDEETTTGMQRAATAFLAGNGYARYEISNYAKPGRACRHNLLYWTREEYLGLGCAAHSFLGGERFHDPEDLAEYLRGERCLDRERISEQAAMEETILLGTRMLCGVDYGAFRRAFGRDLREMRKDRIERLTDLGLIRDCPDALRLTERGLEVQNAVVAELVGRGLA